MLWIIIKDGESWLAFGYTVELFIWLQTCRVWSSLTLALKNNLGLVCFSLQFILSCHLVWIIHKIRMFSFIPVNMVTHLRMFMFFEFLYMCSSVFFFWMVMAWHFCENVGSEDRNNLLSSLFIRNIISMGTSGAIFGLGAMLSELITNWSIHTNKVRIELSVLMLFLYSVWLLVL